MNFGYFNINRPHSDGGIVLMFSVVSVCDCLSVCLCIDVITRELSEISSKNFPGIILRSKGRTV